MTRAYLPFYCVPTPAVHAAIGGNVQNVALAALKAILRRGKGLEVAHQQIVYAGHDLAFSARVTSNGDLVLTLDLGDPKLRHRIVLEADLRREARQVRGVARQGRPYKP
jgi:hypothetical protein